MLPDPDRHAAVAGTLLLTPCSPDPGPDTPMGLLHRSVQPGGRPARYPRREVVNGIRCVVLRLCLAQAAPRTAGPGNWCTTTSWCGGRGASGRRSMMTCCPKPGAPRAVGQSQCGDPRQPVDTDDGKRGPRGCDAGKQVPGRKRHPVVDTQGLLLAVAVIPPTSRTGTAPGWSPWPG